MSDWEDESSAPVPIPVAPTPAPANGGGLQSFAPLETESGGSQPSATFTGRGRGFRGGARGSQERSYGGSGRFPGGGAGDRGGGRRETSQDEATDADIWGQGGGMKSWSHGHDGAPRGRREGRGGGQRGGRGYGHENGGVSYGGGRGDDFRPRGRGGGFGGRDGFRGDFDHEGRGGGGYGDRGPRRGGRGGGGRGGGGDFSRDGDRERDMPREKYEPEEETTDELLTHVIPSGIHFEKYDAIDCKVSGENPPAAIESFAETGLRSILLDNIKKCGYKKPTPVQKHAIPIIREKRDLMACAQTGSGKTGAFLLPMLNRLLEEGVESHAGAESQTPEVVIMAPTRELALQIKDESRKFAMGTNLKSVCIYGGTSVPQQLSILDRGCNILVATPGRLLQFVQMGKISFSALKFFVLDEADRMLDMGFMPDVDSMVREPSMPTKEERQTLLFSATFPSEVQKIARDYLDNYLFLSVGIVGGACEDVRQSVFLVDQFDKRNKLFEILKDTDVQKSKTLIFVEKKKNADFLASFLCQSDFPTTSIHGDRLQSERESALKDFRTSSKPVLVATAVAARGLDIRNVAHVVNYDLPKSIDEYVHRIGRTGRMGNAGQATSFFDPKEDGDLAQDLEKVLMDAKQEVPLFLKEASSRTLNRGSGFNSGGFGGRDIRQKRGGYSNNGRDKAPVSIEADAAGDEEESWD
ncbi:hypothetical protein TCAL_00683 [Tigriopus californicus]|uniref:RNA helicase n=1 Tax=Tigriopus californicus TaxID=6832 RepID=A0A553PC91_TIGCA|nr:ATP-dependent RNA helicase vasa-like [Tigriopus californicus]TRY75278.1 hypothetical protein TCAL_00683 [Tigriopus californicus]|eukprot:TCALIF_00683-PA protein Name:"Similar to vas ATP-dependent RNA helicase vasa, isoform A (Drosophila melanogaster)" AED:0.02 eAED:0.02 QI:726/1/1/1/1/1/3/207/695